VTNPLSFPRKRESQSPFWLPLWLDSRLREDDNFETLSSKPCREIAPAQRRARSTTAEQKRFIIAPPPVRVKSHDRAIAATA
jgi:hypothetical protein